MSHPPTVCAIVPYYLGARYLGDALASAFSQTMRDLEIIVVNDGSPDDFSAVIAPFRSRVRVIEQANAGVAAARNRALDATDAPYIAFLDQDDAWHPEKLARQLAFLDAHPECGLVHTGIQHIDANGAPRPAPPLRNPTPATGRCTEALLIHNSVTMASVLLRRSTLGDARFAAGVDGSDDWDLWLRMSERAEFGYLPDVLTLIRLHGTNVSGRKDVMMRGQLGVLERAVARGGSGAVLDTARARLRAMRADLAHLEFEAGHLAEARRLFALAGPTISAAAMTRYAATFVPDWVRAPVRRFLRPRSARSAS